MRSIVLVPVVLALGTLAGCQREASDVASVAPTSPPSTPAPQAAQPKAAEIELYQGSGTIASVDRSNATVTLDHDAIADLGWPARSMTFDVEGDALAADLDSGKDVRFTLRQGNTGRLIVTQIEPDAFATATAENDAEPETDAELE